jgi:hypothetical protein
MTAGSRFTAFRVLPHGLAVCGCGCVCVVCVPAGVPLPAALAMAPDSLSASVFAPFIDGDHALGALEDSGPVGHVVGPVSDLKARFLGYQVVAAVALAHSGGLLAGLRCAASVCVSHGA